jgi:hypothetical protein
MELSCFPCAGIDARSRASHPIRAKEDSPWSRDAGSTGENTITAAVAPWATLRETERITLSPSCIPQPTHHDSTIIMHLWDDEVRANCRIGAYDLALVHELDERSFPNTDIPKEHDFRQLTHGKLFRITNRQEFNCAMVIRLPAILSKPYGWRTFLISF